MRLIIGKNYDFFWSLRPWLQQAQAENETIASAEVEAA